MIKDSRILFLDIFGVSHGIPWHRHQGLDASAGARHGAAAMAATTSGNGTAAMAHGNAVRWGARASLGLIGPEPW